MPNILFTPTTKIWDGTVGFDGIHLAVIGVEAYGENIHLCCLLPQIRQQVKTLTIIMPDILCGLMRQSNVADIYYPMSHTRPIEADYAIDILALAKAIHITALGGAYLHPHNDDARYWQQVLSPLNTPLVGLAWQGNPTRKGDDTRSASLTDFMDIIAQYPDISFISLQKDKGVETYNLPSNIIYNPMPYIDDFASCAALIAGCAIIISTDTSLPHLSAAIGAKTMLLLPADGTDWRWRHDEIDYPYHRTIWYESMLIWRQEQGETWANTINRTVPLILDNHL